MSAPMATLQLTMKDQFKTFALKTIILQEGQEFSLLWGGGGDTHKKELFTRWVFLYNLKLSLKYLFSYQFMPLRAPPC